MDTWKGRGGKSQKRKEEERDQRRRERVRRKKMQVREKVGKSQNTVFFPCLVAAEGRKVYRLAKAAGAEPHLGRCEMKKCKPLWREADLEVKMLKPPHSRSTLGS